MRIYWLKKLNVGSKDCAATVSLSLVGEIAFSLSLFRSGRSMKVVKTLVKISQGDELAGRAPRLQIQVWSETKGHGKGKTDVISRETDLPPGAGPVEIDDYGTNGSGSRISYSCSDGTFKEIITGKEGSPEKPCGFVAETTT